MPGHVRGAGDVLRDFLRVRDSGVAEVVGAQVLAPLPVEACLLCGRAECAANIVLAEDEPGPALSVGACVVE
ncbi:MAG: hypothetical protein WBN14_07665 [Polyangiales bacterium]